MLLVHADRAVLLGVISKIREFLSGELRLTLHPQKIKLQSADKGFAFLGAYIYHQKVYAGKRIVKNYKECVNAPGVTDPEKHERRVQSYLGLMRHL